MLRYTAMCWWCKHFDSDHKRKTGEFRCKAFPQAIPKEILYDALDHRKPLQDDHGIQFEKLDNYAQLKERNFGNHSSMDDFNRSLQYILQIVDESYINNQDEEE